MSKKESDKSVSDEYYYMTLFDLANDADIRDILMALKDYESKEMYEECAGIKKALDLIEHKTIKELREEYEQIIRDRDEKQ